MFPSICEQHISPTEVSILKKKCIWHTLTHDISVENVVFVATLQVMRLHTDSNYTIKGITEWIQKWKKNGWKLGHGGNVLNKEDFQELDRVSCDIKVEWVKVKGHSNDPGNKMADRLANEGAAKYQTTT